MNASNDVLEWTRNIVVLRSGSAGGEGCVPLLVELRKDKG